MNGPFLIQVFLGRGSDNQRWVDVQWEPTMEKALAIASHMCTSYEYRLYCGPDYGHAKLVWIDDPTDKDLCIPQWQF